METGSGLGLWEWEVGGGDATPIAASRRARPEPGAIGDPSDEGHAVRAPRYAPDGQSLAFVDLAGSIGILELPAERLTLAPFDAAAAPIWMPDSSGVLLTGAAGTGAALSRPSTARRAAGRAVPRTPPSARAVGHDDGRPPPRAGATVLGIGPDGSIAYADPEGLLRIAESLSELPSAEVLTDEPVAAAAIAPSEPAAVVVFADTADSARSSSSSSTTVSGRRSRRMEPAHAGCRDPPAAPC